MAASVPALSSLLQRTDIEDHEEVLRAANAALKKSGGDLEAQHVKAVALLKLDRFEDALNVFKGGSDKLKQQASLEYAYALYKTGSAKEAAQVASKANARGLRHVEAQATYRSEDFKKASEVYRSLSAQLADDAEADLRINASAVDAQLEWAGKGELVEKKKPERADLEAFETAYNAACGSIARGELGQGEVLLRRARDLCNGLEDLTEEEKVAELLPIGVQQVFVLARQGRTAEAEAMAASIETKNIPDASTRYIAQVNAIAASETPANPFLAQRLATKDLDELKPDYTFYYQTAVLQRNNYAADLQSFKFGGVASSTLSTINQFPSPTAEAVPNSLSAVNAAAHAKGLGTKEALKYVFPMLEKRPTDVGLALTIIQIYVLTGNLGSATSMLESFLSRLEQMKEAEKRAVRFVPGLVGAMVSLYTSQGRRSEARNELAKAAEHWKPQDQSKWSKGVAHLLKAAGSALLDSQEPQHQTLAASIFRTLTNANPGDKYASAGLLAADSLNATAASRVPATLTPLDHLTSTISAGDLETAGIATPPLDTLHAATNLKRKVPTSQQDQPNKGAGAKRPRKSRLPKDYDPSKTPDPERWLPLRDRSSYRPKGKKGKQKAAAMSQGAVGAGEGVDGSRPATPGGQVVTGKGQSAGGGAKGKKKGKSGKR
ncbi:hypothetical protein MBLNU230_g7989t1 [Neophaeotheca triangularis]